ncbi:MAG: manganese efflux pump MntP family protein [Spirochaetaceae bacterium]|jgi:putative Mn2+ efflux pump MntP|nr:manganese efflux pump MntP family protein [Spirochaetaceae bacterium]
MGLLEIVLIALGLSMDAFAVSISLGLSAKKPKPVEILLPGLYFGVFQSLMPAAGYFAGAYSAQKIEKIDHWIALVLLGFIGGKMIRDGLARKNGEEQKGAKEGNGNNSFGFLRMLVLAVATSIDALAVGITFAFFKVHLPTAVLITGTVTFVIAMGGVVIGGAFGAKYKAHAECAGGAVLVLIGIKIVSEHLFFS